MAPLPDNLTWRVWIDYASEQNSHSLMLRFPANATEAFALDRALTFVPLFRAILSQDFDITGVRYSAPNTNFSLPAVFTPVPGLAAGVNPVDAPRFVSIVGRTSGGRRVRYFFYGVPVALTADYRIPRGVSPSLDAVYDYLEDQSNFVVGVDNLFATLSGYYNQGLNAYYQREARP